MRGNRLAEALPGPRHRRRSVTRSVPSKAGVAHHLPGSGDPANRATFQRIHPGVSPPLGSYLLQWSSDPKRETPGALLSAGCRLMSRVAVETIEMGGRPCALLDPAW